MLKKTRLNPLQKALANPHSLRDAINAKCYDCCCQQYKEVTLCTADDCSLWPLRPWQNDKTTEIGKN